MFDLYTAATAAQVDECVARGENIEQVRAGITPLISAFLRRNWAVFEALLRHGAKPTNNPLFDGPVRWTPFLNQREWAEQKLVRLRDDITRNSPYLRQRILNAAEDGDESTVEMLLALGASPETKDQEGRSSIFRASFRGHLPVVHMLLVAGANVDNATNCARRPLMAAISQGHTDIVFLLVSYDANINAAGINGKTPLMIAVISGHHHLVRYLAHLRADLDQQDNQGRTVLMHASKKEDAIFVGILLSYGANTQIRDNEGHRAIDLTQSQEIRELIQGICSFLQKIFLLIEKKNQKQSQNQKSLYQLCHLFLWRPEPDHAVLFPHTFLYLFPHPQRL